MLKKTLMSIVQRCQSARINDGNRPNHGGTRFVGVHRTRGVWIPFGCRCELNHVTIVGEHSISFNDIEKGC